MAEGVQRLVNGTVHGDFVAAVAHAARGFTGKDLIHLGITVALEACDARRSRRGEGDR